MPLRSTHDSPFFRELVDRRSIAQERLAEWLRQSIKTIDSSEGITTCLYCLGNVTCDLDGKPHEHNCDRIRQHLQNEHRAFIQLYEGARMPTEEGSEERSDQERKILNCPVCKQCHYLPAMCTRSKQDVEDGTRRITDYFEPSMYCATPTYRQEASVPAPLHWTQGQGYKFPVEYHHGYPPLDLARWDWREHSILSEFCYLCLGPGHTPGTQECPMTPVLRRAVSRERVKGTIFLPDPLDEWVGT